MISRGLMKEKIDILIRTTEVLVHLESSNVVHWNHKILDEQIFCRYKNPG